MVKMNDKKTKAVQSVQTAGKDVKIIVDIKAFYKPETIYLVGDIAKLGNWNLKKAVAVKKNEKGEYVRLFKDVNVEGFEFKILHSPDWCSVEKGIFAEEIENHYVAVSTTQKTTNVTITVYNWA